METFGLFLMFNVKKQFLVEIRICVQYFPSKLDVLYSIVLLNYQD